MRIVKALAMVFAAVLPAAACEEKPAPSPAPPTAPEPAAVQPAASTLPAEQSATPTLPKHMQEHFTRAVKIRDGVIAGDLAATKKDAQWMAEHQISASFPDAWKPHVTNFQDAAKKVLDADKLDAAAEAVAGMAQSCGSCHAALGGPKLTLGAPPAEGSGTTPHMARHQWAAERMWDALTTPSEEAWLKGTEIMADAPLVPKAVSGEKSVDKKVETLAVSVHDIAEKARTDRDMKKWTAAYGKFLQTCASCHQASGGPKTSK
jgi:mono/diheme cytochrome c family protein